MTTIHNSTYTVHIGNDSLLSFREIVCEENSFSKIFVLIDENIRKHCLDKFLQKAKMPPDAIHLIEIESGEQNKTLNSCEFIWRKLTDGGADRRSVLINLGGGVICDMGGYAAASFKRGIKFINVPTTLMAQLDAAIGGKTGINLDHLKNQIGLFQNPYSIFVDADFLESLPGQHLLSGFAEALKYGLIYDKVFWEGISKVKISEVRDWYEWIMPSVRIKMDVVNKDPYEKNLRKILNFGHTTAHAIETIMHRKSSAAIPHGEAVAIGLVVESIISRKVLGLEEQIVKDIHAIVRSDFNIDALNKTDIPEMLAIMMHDKKNVEAKINFTLIKDIGDARIDQFCERPLIASCLMEYIELFLSNASYHNKT